MSPSYALALIAFFSVLAAVGMIAAFRERHARQNARGRS